MDQEWTYAGYWYAVLGVGSAGDVCREHDLHDSPGLDEWLGHAEEAAWSAGKSADAMPEIWHTFHDQALAELQMWLQRKIVKVAIILEIEYTAEDSAESACHLVDGLLDAGFLQDSISDHTEENYGPLHVKSAVCKIIESTYP